MKISYEGIYKPRKCKKKVKMKNDMNAKEKERIC